MIPRDFSGVEVGIIGCGELVQQCYVGLFRSLPGVKVAAVADLNAANAAVVGGALGAEVLDSAGVIARCPWVVVATPPEAHFTVAKAALAAGGRDVIVEKPLTVTVAQAEELVAAAATHGSRVYAAQFRRAFPATLLARDLVASGVIGPVTDIEAFEGGKFAWATKSGYVGTSRYGGVLFDTGSHAVDQALFVAGLESAAAAVEIVKVERDLPEPSHELSAEYRLHGDGEASVTGRLRLSRAQPLANIVRVRGREGVVECDVGFTGQARLFRRGRRIVLAPAHPMVTFVDAFAGEYQDIFRRRADSAFTAASTLLQLKILEGIHQHGS